MAKDWNYIECWVAYRQAFLSGMFKVHKLVGLYLNRLLGKDVTLASICTNKLDTLKEMP